MRITVIQSIKNILFVLFILLIPFQDSGLQYFSKFLGARLSNLPLLLLIFFFFLGLLFSKKVAKKSILFFGMTFLYVLLLGLLPIFLFYDELFYTPYLYRTLFVNMSIIATKTFILCYVIVNYKSDYDKYIVMAFIIAVIGYVICDVLNINLGTFVHGSASTGRARGFSPESSVFGTTVVILGLLSVYTQKKYFCKALFALLTITIVFLSTSKGAIGVILILMYIMIMKSSINKILKTLTTLVAVGCCIYLWNNFIVYLLGIGSENLFGTGSFTTRCSAIITSILIVKDYPLGTGPSAVYGIEFIKHIPEVYDFLSNFIGGYGLDPTEILIMIHNNVTDENANIGSKSGFFNNFAYFGFPFFTYFIFLVSKVQKRLYYYKEYTLWIVFLFIVMAIMFYADVNYDSLFGIGVVLSCYYKKNPNALCFYWIPKKKLLCDRSLSSTKF